VTSSRHDRSNTMRKPTLSVIMANYNHGCYIAEALDAILSQTVLPAEVIVIDDGSTDHSVAVIEGFVRKYGIVTLLQNDVNRGATFSNARGLEVASGDYVYFASADDRILPGFFERCMDLLSQYRQAGLCHSEIRTFDGTEYRFHLSRQPRYFSVDELTAECSRRGYSTASGANSIIRRDALLRSGGVVSQTGPLWDVFAAITVGVRHGLCYIPEPLVCVRTVATSYSGSAKRQGRVLRRILNEILVLLETPAYQDVGEWIRKTGVWPVLFPSMVYLLLKDRRRWRYLSPGLVRRALWRGVRDMVGRIAPLGVKRLTIAICNTCRKLVLALG